MIKLAIIGAGDLGLQIESYAVENGFEIAGYFDDYEKPNIKFGSSIILGSINEAEEEFKKETFSHLIIAIGYNHLNFKKNLFQSLKGKIPFTSVISKDAIIHKSATIEDGCFILPGCILDINATVKQNSVLNCGCILSHDSTVNEHSFLGPGVIMAGFSTIKSLCFIGLGSKIVDSVSVNDQIRTGAGTIVTKDLEKKGLYIGTPAKWIKN